MGPFMVEIVFCRVTRRGRKKKSGMNKLARENCRNDGPMQSFIPKDDMVKVTLDLSDNGPVFSALDDMMLRMSLEACDEGAKKKAAGGADAKKALKNLLRSGIPGIEGMFGGPEPPQPRFGKKGGKKGFHKMNDGSKKKFMTAIFGEDGTQIDSSTAAALLAATCSGGNPEIGNKLAELLVPNMGETVDPAMMAALMSACSLINAGAGTEEVMKAMLEELQASGMSEDEILEKTQLLMKAFGKEDSASTAEYKLLSKQKNKALHQAGISPKDFTAIMLAHKAIAACGTTPENVAKIFIIISILSKKGGNSMHIANVMKNLGPISDELKQEIKSNIITSWNDCTKLGKKDVACPARVHMSLDNENEPSWTEVKNIKDIVGGVSPTSQEAIELNLARATKSGGLKKDDIGRANIALRAISALGVDPVQLAKILFLEKTICDNGVPAVEVARVLSDGLMPMEATQGLIAEVENQILEDIKPVDIDSAVKVYNNLKFKSNNPTEIIDYVDKTLIQVRCSLEDVADNMISTMRGRGEKEAKIAHDVTETLKKTGASASVVSATLMPPLVELTGKNEVELTKLIGRNLKEVEYPTEEVKTAVVDMVVRIIDKDPSQHSEACASLESVFKDLGEFPTAIKDFIASNLPPPPTPPEEIERRNQIAEELARLTREEEERERIKLLKAENPNYEAEEKARNKKMDALKSGESGSRRGSLVPPPPRSRQGSVVIGGAERRGSYYDDGVTTRATVAMVTDDPEHKKNLKKSLSGVFTNENSNSHNQLNSSEPSSSQSDSSNNFISQSDSSNNLKNQSDSSNCLNSQSKSAIPKSSVTSQTQRSVMDCSSNVGSDVSNTSSSLGENGHPVDLKSGLESVLESLSPDATPEEIQAALDASGMDGETKAKMVAAYSSGVSAESRALMQQILASSSSQDEISSRVAALLAGTALSTSRGEKLKNGYGDIEPQTYDIGDVNLSARKRRDDFEMPEIPSIQSIPMAQTNGDIGYTGVTRREGMPGYGKRGSIKRQSELLREARKSRQEEREEDKIRNQSYYRRVTGLRKAKVPLMVYSCGGFSRCFRVARFYDAEGPPVGIVYERPEDERRSLNPDL